MINGVSSIKNVICNDINMQGLCKLLNSLIFQLNLYIFKSINNLNNNAFLMKQGKYYLDQS